MLGIPKEDKYYAMLEKDLVLAVVHLAAALWNFDSAAAQIDIAHVRLHSVIHK